MHISIHHSVFVSAATYASDSCLSLAFCPVFLSLSLPPFVHHSVTVIFHSFCLLPWTISVHVELNAGLCAKSSKFQSSIFAKWCSCSVNFARFNELNWCRTYMQAHTRSKDEKQTHTRTHWKSARKQLMYRIKWISCVINVIEMTAFSVFASNKSTNLGNWEEFSRIFSPNKRENEPHLFTLLKCILAIFHWINNELMIGCDLCIFSVKWRILLCSLRIFQVSDNFDGIFFFSARILLSHAHGTNWMYIWMIFSREFCLIYSIDVKNYVTVEYTNLCCYWNVKNRQNQSKYSKSVVSGTSNRGFQFQILTMMHFSTSHFKKCEDEYGISKIICYWPKLTYESSKIYIPEKTETGEKSRKHRRDWRWIPLK